MANGFEIAQSGNAEWNEDLKFWAYRFVARHDLGTLHVTVGVDRGTPENHRNDEAKKNFRAFVEALSDEVQDWTNT